MVFMEGMYLRTRDPQYHAMTKFWSRIFAVNFAMGVATGIVMEFQFGTNWANYARFVGDVFGSALAAEGIFAFFLESGFLAVLVFGWDRVSPRMHFFATCMVSLGSIFSAIWASCARRQAPMAPAEPLMVWVASFQAFVQCASRRRLSCADSSIPSPTVSRPNELAIEISPSSTPLSCSIVCLMKLWSSLTTLSWRRLAPT